MASAGMELLVSLIGASDVSVFLNLGLEPKLFKPSELELYQFVDNHVRQYGVIPSPGTIGKHTDFDLSEYSVASEPAEYFFDRLKDRYISDTLKGALVEAKGILTGGSPGDALATLSNIVIALELEKKKSQIVDFRDAEDHVVKAYKKKLKGGDDYGIKLGWPYLDDMTGGLIAGDMVSYVGRPAMGKTFQMLYSGYYAWKYQKKRVMMVSMEMVPLLLEQRLAAMHAKMGLTPIKKAELSTKGLNKLVHELKLAAKHPTPFWIVDGNLTATVEDIWRLCRQLKPEVILVDGAYLVKTSDARMGKWERIAYVAEAIKQHLATDLGIPAIATYQFSREASGKKKKKDEKVGLEDIYGSDVIGQVSSVVLGLLEADSVETILRRRIDVLKGRSGETGFFYTNWDFNVMNFSQWKEETLEELQFV